MVKNYIVGALALAALAFCAFWAPAGGSATPQAEPVAKIVYDNGHGSAGYIGDGYFITAAHVVGDKGSAPLLLSDGRKISGTVLWTNKAYDIALVRADVDGVNPAPLHCGVPKVGTSIHASGNPNNQDWVTVWGKVGGRDRATGYWQSVVVVDMAIVPGMSGGPVFDDDGNMVGVTVGVMLAPTGLVPSMVGIGYVVPGKAVCELLARK